MKKGYLYILKSEKNNKYYLGSTIDLNRRLYQHNNNLVLSTKDIKTARQIEYKLKKQKRRDIIEKIISNELTI
jgi:predicted GIY-YIG superfamily endonuclease